MVNIKPLKTGERASVSGFYAYNGPVDRKIACSPTPEECEIPLESGERAPPVKSCGTAANWRFVRKQ